MKKVPLPDYEHPPVIEVVCGIQFDPLPNFLATTLGLFWETIRKEYIQVQEMPPLPQVVEQLPSESAAPKARVELTSLPPLPRIFFVHESPNWIMQVQKDRFLHNWRKRDEDDVYPRYPAVYGMFWNAWKQFLGFCQAEEVGEPVINQLEITYINHIPVGQGWNTLADLSRIFRDMGWKNESRFLPTPEAVASKLSFVMPDSAGRLHISVKHAIRVSDNHPVLLCELTARGVPEKRDSKAICDWFGLGREWIVRGFADIIDFTTQREQWGRKV